jgi:N-acyl-L-homoserine lactone synthetase
MIDVVLPETRFEYAAALMQMHRDRKRVFVDQLHWSLPSKESWLEVDDFDNEYAIYLLARSHATGEHQGSVRLLPSTKRHMLGDLFRELCAGDVPVGEDVWEISRLVTCPPDIPGTSIIKIHRLLALALVEFGLLNQVRRYTLVTEPTRVPALLSIGWPVSPLGLPTQCMGQTLQALEIAIVPETLAMLQVRTRIASSVLQFAGEIRRAA